MQPINLNRYKKFGTNEYVLFLFIAMMMGRNFFYWIQDGKYILTIVGMVAVCVGFYWVIYRNRRLVKLPTRKSLTKNQQLIESCFQKLNLPVFKNKEATFYYSIYRTGSKYCPYQELFMTAENGSIGYAIRSQETFIVSVFKDAEKELFLNSFIRKHCLDSEATSLQTINKPADTALIN